MVIEADIIDPFYPWGKSDEIVCSPIYSRLPVYAEKYRSSDRLSEALETKEPTCIVTRPVDEMLCDYKELLLNFPRDYLLCETVKPEAIDWIAVNLLGFTGPYWDVNWDTEIKRTLICNALKGVKIWENRGTIKILDWILKAFKIKTCPTPPGEGMYTPKFFYPDGEQSELDPAATLPPETANEPDNPAHYIRLEYEVERNGAQWELVERLVHLYASAYNNVRICYCYFYPNKSLPDDPVFSWAYDRSRHIFEKFVSDRGSGEGFWADPFNWWADLFRLIIQSPDGFNLPDVKVIPGCVPDSGQEGIPYDVVIEPYIPFWICLPVTYAGTDDLIHFLRVQLWELVDLYAVPLALRYGGERSLYNSDTVIFDDIDFKIDPRAVVVYETFYSHLSAPNQPFLVCGKSYKQLFP